MKNLRVFYGYSIASIVAIVGTALIPKFIHKPEIGLISIGLAISYLLLGISYVTLSKE